MNQPSAAHRLRFARRTGAATLLLGAIVAAGGCHSATPPPPSVNPSAELNTTERQRQLARADSGLFGFINTAWLKTTWQIDDMADRISGAPTRLATQLEQKDSPDERRRGLIGLADRPWGQKPPYTTRYAQIAADKNNDFLLRAAAIRSLNRSREPGHTQLFISGLSDPNELIRLEAAKALNRLPDPEAVAPLLALANRPDETRDVKLAVIEALKHYKKIDVARSLVGLLNERDFALAWQAHSSLRDLTNKDLGYSEAAWLTFLTGPDKPADLSL